MPPDQLEKRILQIENTINQLVYSDRYIFQRDLHFLDGRNILTGSTNGLKIGTDVGQKIGLWNVTPVIQPTSGDQGALSLTLDVVGADTVSKANINTNFSAIQTLVNRLRTDLVSVGVIKGS